MKYVFMSPIGITRRYALPYFLEGISRLDPAPDRVVFAVDSDAPSDLVEELRSFADEILEIPAVDHPGLLSRISAAREALREWFLSSKYDLSFWLDSDIVVPPDLPLLLYRIHSATHHVVVVHCYPGRGEGAIWHGSGVMLVHRYGAEIGRFIVTSVKGMHISEDYNFFSLVSGAEPLLEHYHGMRGVAKVCVRPDVRHYLDSSGVPATLPADRVTSVERWIAMLSK